jgi:hypothetical protein
MNIERMLPASTKPATYVCLKNTPLTIYGTPKTQLLSTIPPTLRSSMVCSYTAIHYPVLTDAPTTDVLTVAELVVVEFEILTWSL